MLRQFIYVLGTMLRQFIYVLGIMLRQFICGKTHQVVDDAAFARRSQQMADDAAFARQYDYSHILSDEAIAVSLAADYEDIHHQVAHDANVASSLSELDSSLSYDTRPVSYGSSNMVVSGIKTIISEMKTPPNHIDPKRWVDGQSVFTANEYMESLGYGPNTLRYANGHVVFACGNDVFDSETHAINIRLGGDLCLYLSTLYGGLRKLGLPRRDIVYGMGQPSLTRGMVITFIDHLIYKFA